MTKWDKAISELATLVWEEETETIELELTKRLVPLLEAISEMCISQPTTKRLREELTKWLK